MAWGLSRISVFDHLSKVCAKTEDVVVFIGMSTRVSGIWILSLQLVVQFGEILKVQLCCSKCITGDGFWHYEPHGTSILVSPNTLAVQDVGSQLPAPSCPHHYDLYTSVLEDKVNSSIDSLAMMFYYSNIKVTNTELFLGNTTGKYFLY